MRFLIYMTTILLFFGCTSRSDYAPKPKGYFRIEPDSARYTSLSLDELPYTFSISQLATVELPPQESKGDHWINLSYPSLQAKLYCTYLPVTPATLYREESESRELVARQTKDINSIQEKAYSDPQNQVYGSLFLLDGGSASPIQFMLTDSASHFFRASLYFDCKPNADSLAPAVDYLRKDIVELIQSFSWKK